MEARIERCDVFMMYARVEQECSQRAQGRAARASQSHIGALSDGALANSWHLAWSNRGHNSISERTLCLSLATRSTAMAKLRIPARHRKPRACTLLPTIRLLRGRTA